MLGHKARTGVIVMARDNNDEFPDDGAIRSIVSKIKIPKGSKKASNAGAVKNIKATMGRKNIKTKKKAASKFTRKFKG
jgi:hypothetical protein